MIGGTELIETTLEDFAERAKAYMRRPDLFDAARNAWAAYFADCDLPTELHDAAVSAERTWLRAESDA